MEMVKSILLFLWKVLLCLVLTPFFLFTWLKNSFFLGIGLTISYVILGLLYVSFIEQKYYTPDEFEMMMFTDTKITILIVIVIVMALLAAIYDYQDKFEDIMLL